MSARHCLIVSILVLLLGNSAPLAGQVPAKPGEWPQWRGPNRDGISAETGLLKEWPKGGPPLAWKAKGLGEGFSGVSVAGGRIFTMGNRSGKEVVIALEETGGKELWAAEVGAVRGDGGGMPGPRCTPTIDGPLVYALGLNGDLLCLEASGGKVRWRKDLVAEFQGETPVWGYSESPLVDGNRLVCTPGGKEATLAALDKATGALIWKSFVPRGTDKLYGADPKKPDGAEYSSMVAGEAGGIRQYVQFLKTGVAGVAAGDGKFLWRYNRTANDTANVCTPLLRDGFVFAASNYAVGGALVKLEAKDGTVAAKEVYFNKQMQVHHGGVICLGDLLFGFDRVQIRCIDFKTGKNLWVDKDERITKGSLAAAEGRIYARSENGPVALLEASAAGYVEKGRFDQPGRSSASAWPHPVIAGGRLYLRDQDLLLCYDIRERPAGRP